jgi:hypothetical protein
MPLPADLLRKRVRNELDNARTGLADHRIEVLGDLSKFPIMIKVTLKGVPGPDMVEGKVVHRTDHIFLMEISEEYPYKKPLVIWGTPIFHPNIMVPDDGGFVCTKLLDDWNFDSNLLLFIKGIEVLLSYPNPTSPYGTDSCTRAAELFNREPYMPPGGALQKGPAAKKPLLSLRSSPRIVQRK